MTRFDPIPLDERLSSLSLDALDALWQRLEADAHAAVPEAGAYPTTGTFPATQAQVLFWRSYFADPEVSDNHQSMAFRIHGPLDERTLALALQALSEAQPALRTVYFEDGDGVWQRVMPSLPIPLTVVGSTDARPGGDDEHSAMMAFLREPFQLERQPPIRIRLVRYHDGEHLLQIVMHHIASDGRSKVVLLDDLTAYYDTILAGAAMTPRVPGTDTGRLALSEREWLSGVEAQASAAYWQALPFRPGLAHAWPVDREDRNLYDPGPTPPGRLDFTLDGDLWGHVRAFAAARGMTPFQVLVGCYALALQRLLPGQDITLGMPVDLRQTRAEASLVGCLMNTVPVIMDREMPESIEDYLAFAAQRIRESVTHARMPLVRLLESSMDKAPPPAAPTAFWRTLVNHKEDHTGALAIRGAIVEAMPLEETGNTADLTLTFPGSSTSVEAAAYVVTVDYDPVRLPVRQAFALLETWRLVIRQVLSDSDVSVADIDILLPGERERILERSGRHHVVPYPKTTLHDIFRQTAERHPDRPAVIAADGTETPYADLQQQAMQIAGYLRSLGIEKEAVVAIHLQRSPALLAAMLGVLEAGGAFLLLEPSLPMDRLRTIAEQARVGLLLSEEGMPSIPGFEQHTHLYSKVLAEQLTSTFEEGLPSDPEALACVIFTSGSTGIPKGAMLEHKNLVNYLSSVADIVPDCEDIRTLQKTLLSFDACLFELLLPMFKAGSVVMPEPSSSYDSDRLAEVAASHRVSHAFFAPVQLRNFLEAPKAKLLSKQLRFVSCGGETMDESIVKNCLERLSAQLFHIYGPAESAIWVSQWEAHSGHDHPKPPIGRPNPNVDILIMDPQGKPMPPGMPGELWIGGAQTGRGYIHNEPETRKRFVDDPIEPGSGRRYYRTGDIARFLPDGNLLFLGRIDDQVKVRGVRIELGDVASALLRCTGVREAVVLPEPDGEGSQRLRAWVTVSDHADSSETALRTELLQLLPPYMVPFRIHVIDAVPLTAHGKTDHRALRTLAEQHAADTDAALPLETATQQRLATLWSELLRVDVPSRDADFFRLGGHSLLAMRLAGRLPLVFGVPLDLQTFLHDARLERLAASIDAATEKGNASRHAQPVPEGTHTPAVPTAFPLWQTDTPGGLYFCGGSLAQSQNLIRQLTRLFEWTWNAFHLTDPQYHDGAYPAMPMEQLAARYAQTVLSVHQGGPIVLTGYCLNGLDAYATAVLLQRQSDFPVHVLLLDTHHPQQHLASKNNPTHRRPNFRERLHHTLDNLLANFRQPFLDPKHIHATDMTTLRSIGGEATRLGLLQPDWYLSFNRDLTASNVDPVMHYLSEGWKEGRMPSLWFHTDTYAMIEPGFQKTHPDPVRHFLAHGIRKPSIRSSVLTLAGQWQEFVASGFPHEIFDAEWYLARYPEVKSTGLTAVLHYMLQGWREYRRPSVHFNRTQYAAICPAFDPARHNPVLHFLLNGRFDRKLERAVGALRLKDTDVRNIHQKGWFDADWYNTHYGGTGFQRQKPLHHYMAIGWRHGRKPFEAYDAEAFRRRFPDFNPAKSSPIHHLLAIDAPAADALDIGMPVRARTTTVTGIDGATQPHAAPAGAQSGLQSNTSSDRNEELHIRSAATEPLPSTSDPAIRRAYRPERFDGKVHILVNQHQYDIDPTMGWNAEEHGSLQTHRIQGDHDSILNDDLKANAIILNGILKDLLKPVC